MYIYASISVFQYFSFFFCSRIHCLSILQLSHGQLNCHLAIVQLCKTLQFLQILLQNFLKCEHCAWKWNFTCFYVCTVLAEHFTCFNVYNVLAWTRTRLAWIHCRAILHKTHLYYVSIIQLAARVHWVKLQPSQLPSPFNCLLNNANHKYNLQITNTNHKYNLQITNANLITIYKWQDILPHRLLVY